MSPAYNRVNLLEQIYLLFFCEMETGERRNGNGETDGNGDASHITSILKQG